MARLTLNDGLRGPGEDLALQWGSFVEEHIVLIRERVYERKFDRRKAVSVGSWRYRLEP